MSDGRDDGAVGRESSLTDSASLQNSTISTLDNSMVHCSDVGSSLFVNRPLVAGWSTDETTRKYPNTSSLFRSCSAGVHSQLLHQSHHTGDSHTGSDRSSSSSSPSSQHALAYDRVRPSTPNPARSQEKQPRQVSKDRSQKPDKDIEREDGDSSTKEEASQTRNRTSAEDSSEEAVPFPDYYYLNEGAKFWFDLPEKLGLDDAVCDVVYEGTQSLHRLVIEGRRRRNRYGVVAEAPAWPVCEPLDVTLQTKDGAQLGRCRLHVYNRSTLSIRNEIQMEVRVVFDKLRPDAVEGNRYTLETKILTPDYYNSSPVLPPPSQTHAHSTVTCNCHSNTTLKRFFQATSQFFITHGIPLALQENVLDLLASPPNLKDLLESWPFSNGSCEGLLCHVESSSKDVTTVRLFKDLVEKARLQIVDQASCGEQVSTDLGHPTASSESEQERIYEDVEQIRQNSSIFSENRGLVLPSSLDAIPKEYCQELLEGVRDKMFTIDKAIELARDFVYANPKSLSVQPSKTSKRQLKRAKSYDDLLSDDSGVLSQSSLLPPSLPPRSTKRATGN